MFSKKKKFICFKCKKKYLVWIFVFALFVAATSKLARFASYFGRNLKRTKNNLDEFLYFNFDKNRSLFGNSEKNSSQQEKYILHMHEMNIDIQENYDQSFMRKMEKRMEERRKTLENGCKKLGWWSKQQKVVKYAVLKSYNLTYCFIPKVGCTNWKKVFMTLNQDVKDIDKINQNIHVFVSDNFRVEAVGIPPGTNGFLKMIVVRNPLDRLFSAYTDKFAWRSDGALPEFAKRSMHIHTQQSHRKPDFEDHQYLATFDEFVNYVSTNNYHTVYGIIENHWSTYYRVCLPCSINYDIIMHLETIEEDSKYFLKLIGAPKNVKYPSGYGANGTSTSKHEAVLQAFKHLRSKTLLNFYKAYKPDFDLFGYEFMT